MNRPARHACTAFQSRGQNSKIGIICPIYRFLSYRYQEESLRDNELENFLVSVERGGDGETPTRIDVRQHDSIYGDCFDWLKPALAASHRQRFGRLYFT